MNRTKLRQVILNSMVEAVDLKNDGLRSHDLEIAFEKYITIELDKFYPKLCKNCNHFEHILNQIGACRNSVSENENKSVCISDLF